MLKINKLKTCSVKYHLGNNWINKFTVWLMILTSTVSLFGKVFAKWLKCTVNVTTAT